MKDLRETGVTQGKLRYDLTLLAPTWLTTFRLSLPPRWFPGKILFPVAFPALKRPKTSGSAYFWEIMKAAEPLEQASLSQTTCDRS
jgi:hypothetical protein